MKKKVTVTYGHGDPKKHSVRYAAIYNDANIDARKIGDVYISREILGEIGGFYTSKIRVTFEVEE